MDDFEFKAIHVLDQQWAFARDWFLEVDFGVFKAFVDLLGDEVDGTERLLKWIASDPNVGIIVRRFCLLALQQTALDVGPQP